jgi:hypothetical protein
MEEAEPTLSTPQHKYEHVVMAINPSAKDGEPSPRPPADRLTNT